jgi:1-phosphofructokinase/tagatose 6-phosphate kinase
VVDPTAGSYTEINEWGPHVEPDELAMLLDKIAYLSRGADLVVFAGSLPRGVEENFYAEAIRDLHRRNVRAVLDCEGEPLRLGAEAEPFLVSPNQIEAEGLVGHEFRDEEDNINALERIADLGPRNVLVTSEAACFGLFREERRRLLFRAQAPRVEPVSAVGSGDVLLAAFLAARLAERPLDEALRSAVAAGAASTLEIGAGRFDPRGASRLHNSVKVEELEPVTADR